MVKTTRENLVLSLPSLRSTAIEVDNPGLVREDAVMVEREALLELPLAVVLVGGEVLEGGLDIVVAGKRVEQRRALPTEARQPVLVTQCHREPELQDQPRDLNTSLVIIVITITSLPFPQCLYLAGSGVGSE